MNTIPRVAVRDAQIARITDAIDASGLSVAQVAARTGYPASTIYRWISGGNRRPLVPDVFQGFINRLLAPPQLGDR